MKLKISLAKPKIWKPLTLEHVEPEPKTFYSERELRDYCRKNKLSSGALL